jgi:DNA-binding SARP family transcriptional activator/TolB-like protein
MAFLWPERDAELGRHSLSQTLHAIRKDLGAEALLAGIDEVRVNSAVLACDLWDFEDARGSGDLRRASETYTGPFLDGFFIDEAPEFEHWVEGERQRLARAYEDVVEGLARQAAGAGALVEAAQWWQRRAELDPLDSRVAVALMNALAAGGNRAGAIQHARLHASVLRRELGVGPNVAVAALAQRLAAETATDPLENVPTPVPLDVERHRRLQAALGARYRVAREVGSGGMATVYVAVDLRHGRQVAVKVLKPDVAAALGTDRFLREIGIAARLEHPHVLPLFDSGTLAGDGDPSGLYYVTPFVAGGSLRHRLRLERQLPVEVAIRIATEAAAALGHAHEHGIVHRDIKPENILLQDGSVLVADFGLARAIDLAGGERLTATGVAVGTPHYMSPEQATASPEIDSRTDIYALGCVLYEMLAGEAPFNGPTAQAIMARHAVDPVPPLRTIRPTVSPSLEAVVTKALAKVPADRFATAGEFAAALASASRPSIAVEGSAFRAARRALPAVAAALVAIAGGTWLIRFIQSPKVIPSASVIAVLPFTPSVTDTMLTRLGRDLVLTLSASLDGLGPIRVVDPHTILAQTKAQDTTQTLEPGIGVGRRLGAGSVVHGSLVRVGSKVRLDLGLFPADRGTDHQVPLARASATNSPDSIAALTDSISRSLLRHVWQRGAAPTPSLEAALKTRSVSALRTFLEGERAMLQGRWALAANAYERTIQADSTFWLAYARDVYALGWTAQGPDSAIKAASEQHRFELPERDRLVIESGMLSWTGDSVSAGLALAQRITERFPDYWFGWMNRADLLVHLGPHLGLTRRDAIDALEQTLALAPDFVPGWEHLVWMYLQEHDSAGTARALNALTRLSAGESLSEGCFGCDYLEQIRLLVQSDRPGGAGYRALVDSVARDVTQHWWAMPVLPLWYGFQQPLIDVNRRALRSRTSSEDWTLGLQIARAWAARGAWDSAVVAMDHYVPGPTDPPAALLNYPLVVAGVLVGALDPREAVRRGEAVRAARPLDAVARADVAWLDGVVAAHRGDRAGFVAARAAVRQAGSDAALLDRSLAAFELGLNGDTRRAGQALAAFEWERAERPMFASLRESYVTAFDRLTASRWLLAAGDTAQAARLLSWHEAYDFSSIAAVLAPLIYLERARIEDARGQVALARGHYEQFLRRYDMPMPRHRHLVREARLALGRISGQDVVHVEGRP